MRRATDHVAVGTDALHCVARLSNQSRDTRANRAAVQLADIHLVSVLWQVVARQHSEGRRALLFALPQSRYDHPNRRPRLLEAPFEIALDEGILLSNNATHPHGDYYSMVLATCT